jgi:hypothetical protein
MFFPLWTISYDHGTLPVVFLDLNGYMNMISLQWLEVSRANLCLLRKYNQIHNLDCLTTYCEDSNMVEFVVTLVNFF